MAKNHDSVPSQKKKALFFREKIYFHLEINEQTGCRLGV